MFAHRDDGHRDRDRGKRDQLDRADVVGRPGPSVTGAEPSPAGSARQLRREELRLGSTEERGRQYRAPGGSKQISRPRAAEVPHRSRDNWRRGRAKPGEKAEPAEIFGIALGQLGDQRLCARPGEGDGRPIHQLQQQQRPKARRQRKQRRQRHADPDENKRDGPRTETVHQDADMDRQEQGEDRTRSHQDADFRGIEPER